MKFKTSLGTTSIIITIAVTILFAILIGGQFSLIKDAGHANPFYTTVACLIFYFIAFAFRPIRYVITNDEIIIIRPFVNAYIKRSDIVNVECLDRNKIKSSIRTFGIGGLFGFYGNFANLSLGRMTWYITRKDKLVQLMTNDNKKIILSPNETELFIQAMAS